MVETVAGGLGLDTPCDDLSDEFALAAVSARGLSLGIDGAKEALEVLREGERPEIQGTLRAYIESLNGLQGALAPLRAWTQIREATEAGQNLGTRLAALSQQLDNVKDDIRRVDDAESAGDAFRIGLDSQRASLGTLSAALMAVGQAAGSVPNVPVLSQVSVAASGAALATDVVLTAVVGIAGIFERYIGRVDAVGQTEPRVNSDGDLE